MNKASKHKNSTRTIKSSRNLTLKDSLVATSRTPQNNPKKLEIKRGANMQKFKSIPTIPHRDIQMTTIPTDIPIYQSYTGNPIDTVLTINESEPRLLYSVSDRNNYSVSKVSLHSKIRGSSKKTTVTNKNMSNFTLESHRRNLTF